MSVAPVCLGCGRTSRRNIGGFCYSCRAGEPTTPKEYELNRQPIDVSCAGCGKKKTIYGNPAKKWDAWECHQCWGAQKRAKEAAQAAAREQWAKAKREGRGCVKPVRRKLYIVSPAGHSAPLKIGIAADAERRLKDLQVGSPVLLTIRAVGEIISPLADDISALAAEKILHRKLARYHTHGEWFNTSVEKIVHASKELRGPYGSYKVAWEVKAA